MKSTRMPADGHLHLVNALSQHSQAQRYDLSISLILNKQKHMSQSFRLLMNLINVRSHTRKKTTHVYMPTCCTADLRKKSGAALVLWYLLYVAIQVAALALYRAIAPELLTLGAGGATPGPGAGVVAAVAACLTLLLLSPMCLNVHTSSECNDNKQ